MHGRGRFREFEVMRGVAIVFVVYLHAYFSPWDVTPHDELLVYRVTHLFAHTAVPVFFFLSAFLLARDQTASLGEFANKKLRRLGVPLAFWVLAATAYRVWQADGATEGLTRKALLLDVSGQFFFIGVLAVFTAASWLIRGWTERQLAWLAAVAFAANLLTVIYYESSVIGGDFATLAYRNPATWVFFFAFGYWAGRRFETLEWAVRALPYALIAMALAGASYLVMGELHGRYPVSYFGTSVFVFSSASLVGYTGLLALADRWTPSALALVPFEHLGRYAFAIYLVHMPFFIGFVTERYVSDSSLADDWLQLMLGLFAVGLVTSLAFVVAVERVAPRFAAEFLGLPPRQPRRAGTASGGLKPAPAR